MKDILSMDFTGKVVMVTGAAQGIGYGTCKLFAERGATVVMLDVNREVESSLKTLKNSDKSKSFQCDVTNRQEVDRVISETMALYSRIDILVNNAGICLVAPAEDLSEEYWDRTMLVNIKSVFYLSQVVGRVMIAQKIRGKIVNLASQAGVVAYDENAAYSSSKAAVIALTKDLALEWAEFGIQVNAVSPTVVNTDMARRLNAGEAGERMMKKIPAGRFVEIEEVAAAIVFLASNAADMVTGINLMVDGGFTIQ